MAEIIAISLLLFPVLVYYCTRYIRSLDLFSFDIFPMTQTKMDTTIHFAHRKRYYFGFTHTNNFRPPKKGEWYQSESDLLPIESGCDWDFDDSNISKRSRWILTKNAYKGDRPITYLYHNLPHLNENKILKELQSQENTVRINRQWLRGMLTNGRPDSALEPIIEGLVISLFKNLAYNGYNVIVDEPVVGNRAKDFWKNVIEKINSTTCDVYGHSDITESLALDSNKPVELQHGGATICNYGLDNYSYSWNMNSSPLVLVVLENVLISDENWIDCGTTAKLVDKIKNSSVDAFVKTWLQETIKTNPISVVTTLPERVANEAYRLLRAKEVPFKFLFSRRNKEIDTPNAEVISRIVTEIPSYKILHVIDSSKNNYTWEHKHNKMNKIKVIRI